MNNPSYPHQHPGDPFKYYSGVNHHARALLFLTEIYSVTGNQIYLDRAIQLTEEIICWQDYQDLRDPWGEPPGPNGEWDGGWYWYDYSAQPPLECTDPPPLGSGSFAANRRMAYHQSCVLGFTRLLEITSQQLLPGLTTLKNGDSFLEFRDKLTSAIIKSLNFMIDGQENSTSGYKVYGLFKEFKKYRDYGTGYTNYSTITVSAPHGLQALINAYIAFAKLDGLEYSDLNRLLTLIYSIAEHSYGARGDNGWAADEWRTEAMMMNWAHYISYASFWSDYTEMELRNEGFEDIDIIWELWSWDEYGVEVSSNQAHTGIKSLHILDESTSSGKWGSIVIKAAENINYIFEAYAHIISGFQSMYMQFLDNNFQQISDSYSLTFANSGFTKRTLTRMAPDNTKYLRIRFHAPWYYTNEGYWDNVSVTADTADVVSKRVSYNNDDYGVVSYPNPFNPISKIIFNLPEDGQTEIILFDILGNRVKTVLNEYLSKGSHECILDCTDLSSGTYIYKIKRGQNIQVKKVLLMK